MEQSIVEIPLPQPKPEIRPVEAIEGKVQGWTEKGKAWLDRLRGKVDDKPKEVIKEVAEAPEHKSELVVQSDEPAQEVAELTGKANISTLEGEDAEEKRIETVPFGFKQRVIKLSREQVVPDKDFPSVPSALETPLNDFAVQVADLLETDTNEYMIATNKSGRQLFTEPVYNIEYGGRQLTTVMIKSTGMPEVVRRYWEEYHEAAEPFFFAKKISGGDVPTGLLGKDEFMGLALKEDQRLDAENSLRLHKAGVKVRVPLGGWQIKDFRVGGQQRNIEWFKAQGYEGEELFQSAWGVTCPIRLDDINAMLTETVCVEKDPSKLDPVLQKLIEIAKKDQSKPYQELAIKWGDIGSTLTDEQRVAIWTDFGIAISKTMGQNFEALQKAGLSHGNIHDQNITFFGEICDCSTVKEGLLRSGGPQKIGDDVDSFADGMRQFCDRLLTMQGIDTWKESQKVIKMLDTVIYPQVRNEWRGYEDWVKTNTQQLIDDQQRRSEVKSRLAESYGEQDVNEDMITGEILRRTGGESRFRSYG